MECNSRVECNVCGRTLPVEKEHNIVTEDFINIEKKWGYFSNKDGMTHSFTICEKCYDTLIKKLLIPVKIEETTEIL